MSRERQRLRKAYRLPANIGQRAENFVLLYITASPIGAFFAEHILRGRDGQPIAQSKENQQEIRRAMASMLVPARETRWIKEDQRQLNWISQRIGNYFPTDKLNIQKEIKGKNLIFAQIDICNIPIETKQQNLHWLKIQWENTLKEDKIFNRIKGNDEGIKIQFITDWANKNFPASMQGKSLKNTNDVIMLFDGKEFNKADKVKCLQSIMNRYNKQKSRKNNDDTKQCNISLSSESKMKLKSMTENDHSSQAELIERLIEKEWEFRQNISHTQPQST